MNCSESVDSKKRFGDYKRATEQCVVPEQKYLSLLLDRGYGSTIF